MPRPPSVYPLLTYRLRRWLEECRPPAEVMDFLKRQHLLATARSLCAGRQIKTAVDALEAAGIPSVRVKGLAFLSLVPSLPDPLIEVS